MLHPAPFLNACKELLETGDAALELRGTTEEPNAFHAAEAPRPPAIGSSHTVPPTSRPEGQHAPHPDLTCRSPEPLCARLLQPQVVAASRAACALPPTALVSRLGPGRPACAASRPAARLPPRAPPPCAPAAAGAHTPPSPPDCPPSTLRRPPQPALHPQHPRTMSPLVVVRPCSSPADCARVAELCGASFPEECHGQGLSVEQWQRIEADELSRTPSWWRQIGAPAGCLPPRTRSGAPRGAGALPAGAQSEGPPPVPPVPCAQAWRARATSCWAWWCSRSKTKRMVRACRRLSPPAAACRLVPVPPRRTPPLMPGQRLPCRCMQTPSPGRSTAGAWGAAPPSSPCSMTACWTSRCWCASAQQGAPGGAAAPCTASVPLPALHAVSWPPPVPDLPHPCRPAPLQEHECLIDFIAVSPDARGKGVGALLMAWAEQAGAAILAETETSAVAAHGVDMTLWVGAGPAVAGRPPAGRARRCTACITCAACWPRVRVLALPTIHLVCKQPAPCPPVPQVAADNAAAVRLYQKCGYVAVKRTDQGACHCMASRILHFFLVSGLLPAQHGLRRPVSCVCAAWAAKLRSCVCRGGSVAAWLTHQARWPHLRRTQGLLHHPKAAPPAPCNTAPPLLPCPPAGPQCVDQDAQAAASARPPGGGQAGAAEHTAAGGGGGGGAV